MGGRYVKDFDRAMHWAANSIRRTKEEKIEILEVLQKYIDDGICDFGNFYTVGVGKDRKKVDLNYILDKYKSLKDFYIDCYVNKN